jgi:hypothetical protein
MHHNIIHQYFKKEIDKDKILVQVNPESLRGIEILVDSTGAIKKTKRVFDALIFEELNADEFKPCSPLEFNLYLKGLVR